MGALGASGAPMQCVRWLEAQHARLARYTQHVDTQSLQVPVRHVMGSHLLTYVCIAWHWCHGLAACCCWLRHPGGARPLWYVSCLQGRRWTNSGSVTAFNFFTGECVLHVVVSQRV